MKKYLIIGLLFFCSACKKQENSNRPGVLYTDLNDKEIKFHDHFFLDLNKDGEADVFFSTLLVGDPIAKQDKKKYYVSSRINSFLPVNSNENAPVLNKGDRVPTGNFQGYTWYEVSWVELVQKVTGISGPSFWEGVWKNSSHQYLPIQVKVNNQRFTGWVELSFDMNEEKIILHKAAISLEPGKELTAGS